MLLEQRENHHDENLSNETKNANKTGDCLMQRLLFSINTADAAVNIFACL